MPAKKVRVELVDSEGNRYSISFEGQVTRDKAVRLLDLVELLGGMPSGANDPEAATSTMSSELSKYDKVRIIVQKHFPVVWFSSRELQSVYEHEFKEPIGLSTVATYLSRMATKSMVARAGGSSNLKYRVMPHAAQAILEQKLR